MTEISLVFRPQEATVNSVTYAPQNSSSTQPGLDLDLGLGLRLGLQLVRSSALSAGGLELELGLLLGLTSVDLLTRKFKDMVKLNDHSRARPVSSPEICVVHIYVYGYMCM
eukprot:1064112-Amorphochlora_amoeboformis.AAC.1